MLCVANAMNASRKEKSPERDLVVAIIACLFFGLFAFSFSVWVYFHRHDFDVLHGRASVSTSTFNSVLDLMLFLALYVVPSFGLGFLGICYMVWKAYRKCKLASKNEYRNA
jgi:hypothetical protein